MVPHLASIHVHDGTCQPRSSPWYPVATMSIGKGGRVLRLGQKSWLRRLFPGPRAHIPSDAELDEHRERVAKAIVIQHAEGSTLLGEGKFEITGDLLADDASHQTGANAR